jgi:hypothetical protein
MKGESYESVVYCRGTGMKRVRNLGPTIVNRRMAFVPTKLIWPNIVHLSSGGYQSKSLELSNQYKARRRCGTNTRTPPARNLLGKGNRNGIALLRRQQNSTKWNGVISSQFNWVLETNFLKGRAISPWCFGTMACPCWQFMTSCVFLCIIYVFGSLLIFLIYLEFGSGN